jgi:hypothetical protein
LEKVENKAKTAPQRLKPDCKCGTYGTAEAVPLSKTEYFNKLLGSTLAAVIGSKGEGLTALL